MLFKAAASALAFGAIASATYPAEVTYTSVDHVTITSCAPEITNCPGRVTPTTYYAVSTCTEEGNTPAPPPGYTSSAPVPTPTYTSIETTTECTESTTPVYTSPAVQTTPVYTSPAVQTTPVYTSPAVETTPVYTSPAVETTPCETTPVESSPAVQTTPVYTPPAYNNGTTTPCSTPVPAYTTSIVTVCPGVNYCYATTSLVPSTYAVPSSPVYTAPSSPAHSAPSSPAYTVPSGNTTVPTSPATPVPYSGNSASGNKVSAVVLAIAGVAGLMMAI